MKTLILALSMINSFNLPTTNGITPLVGNCEVLDFYPWEDLIFRDCF